MPVHSDAETLVIGRRASFEFSAYADDYTVRGEIMLRGQRLADHIDGADELRVEGVTVRALEDGREHNLHFAVIHREELCVVAATGPRGDANLRSRTRTYPMRAEIGPYAVVGYLHASPTADPRVVTQRRRIIALSPARVAFIVAGERVDEEHDALLLMGNKIVSLDHASDDDVGLSRTLEASTAVDPGANDLAEEVRWRERG